MAFSLNKKTISAKETTQVPLWKVEHIDEIKKEFVTLVLDEPLIVSNTIDKEILLYLEKMLQKAGIDSYVITSSLLRKPTEKERRLGKAIFYVENDSKWFQEIIVKARSNGYTADVVIPFGASLYQITKNGVDFTVDDLIYPAFENYVYIGHGWIGNYDCFLFPQYPIYDIFCPGSRNLIELQGWKMNFMITVLRKIAAKQYQLPDDMSTPNLVEIGADYDSNKEKAVDEVKAFLRKRFNEDICAFDLETSGFSAWKDRIRCITLAFDSSTGYYLEWKIFAENPELISLLSEMMLSCKNRITVNGKFDIKFLWANGLSTDVTVTEDAMTLCHCLCSGRKKGLKTQAFFWTPHGGYDHDLDMYRDNLKKQGIKDPSYYDIPKTKLFIYAAMDAVMTVRVFLAGVKRMHRFDQDYPTEKPIEHTGGHAYTCYEWYKFVMQIYPVVCKMEYDGLYVDEHVIELHRDIFRKKIQETRKQLGKILNVDPSFDFGSTTKLGKLLEERGWPCHGIAANGGYETSGPCFREWIREEQQGVKELIAFRKASVCLNTYLGTEETTVNQRTGVVKKTWSGWPQFIVHHEDGTDRLHCDFGVCATETFRMISKNPNLQNVPTHSDEGSITKMCFSCPPAPMIFITDKVTGKQFEVTQLGVIKTARGYATPLNLNLEDTIIDSDETVLEFDEWSSQGIDPLGIESLYTKYEEKQVVVKENDRLKIEIDPFNKKAGKLCYLLMTQDAASLEARVATADTALNEEGIDQALYSVYDPVHGHGDLHSQTALNTFCKSINMQINEFEDEKGNIWLCTDMQTIQVRRNGEELIVKGNEVLETDEIVGYVS